MSDSPKQCAAVEVELPETALEAPSLEQMEGKHNAINPMFDSGTGKITDPTGMCCKIFCPGCAICCHEGECKPASLAQPCCAGSCSNCLMAYSWGCGFTLFCWKPTPGKNNMPEK